MNWRRHAIGALCYTSFPPPCEEEAIPNNHDCADPDFAFADPQVEIKNTYLLILPTAMSKFP